MNKRILMLLVLMIMIFTSCKKSTNNELETMKQSYNSLVNEYNEQDIKYQQLINECDILKTQLESSEKEKEDTLKQLEELNTELYEVNSRLQYLEAERIELQSIAGQASSFDEIVLWKDYAQRDAKESVINNYDNIFDPREVKVEDIVGGFKVIDVDIDHGESVVFEGSIILTGSLYIWEDGGSIWLSCDNQELSRSIPISTSWLELYEEYNKNSKSFYVSNQEDLIEAIGSENREKLLSSITQGTPPITFKIAGVFNNFIYNFVPESESVCSLNLVELLSIEEVNN